MEALAPRFGDAVDPASGKGLAIVVALLLRLSWTIGEVVVALTLYAIKPRIPD
jgi:hypothetical protein